MWKCPSCGETVEDNFGSCWNCSTDKDAPPSEYKSASSNSTEGEAETWYCDNCDAEIEADDNICPRCGTDVSTIAGDSGNEAVENEDRYTISPTKASLSYRTQSPLTLKRFLNFDEFITGRLLKAIYLLGAIIILLAALSLGILPALAGLMLALNQDFFRGALVSLFLLALSIGVAVFGVILWRVYCERIMVIFKINENLQVLRDAGMLSRKSESDTSRGGL